MLKQVFVKENSWLAKCGAKKLKANAIALTIGNTIYLHNANKEQLIQNTTWLCHELMHVKQYEKLGTVRFLAIYIFEWIVKGYYNNRFEVEARAMENDYSILLEYVIV